MPVSAVEPSTLVATTLQDEPRKIPEDNTAYFSRADRKVRFQLVKLAGVGNEMLAGTNVKVIGPSGEETVLIANNEGIATLEDAKSGLHALVIVGDKGHTAVPIAVREGDRPNVDESMPANASASVKLAMMEIDPQEVVRLTSSYLTPTTDGTYDDIDTAFVADADVSQGLQYRVRLGDEGTLDGQVYSLVNSNVSTFSVEGTNLMIYRGDDLVVRTTADQFGRFTVNEMRPGVYGMVAAGPAGYAAFGFEAYEAAAVAGVDLNRETLVSVADSSDNLVATGANMARGSVLPVLLIPPAMVPSTLLQIQNAAADLGIAGVDGMNAGVPGGIGSSPIGGAPGVGGGFGPAGTGGGFGGGAAGGGGIAGGGFGPILGLAAIGGIAAAVIGNDDDNNDNQVSSPGSL